MTDETTISSLISEGLDTIESHETVRAAHRRMESQTLRSLIVVDEDRPVGVVKWRDLRNADANSPVTAHMTSDFPVLRNDMRISEAHGHLGGVDFDNIPVINEEGRLVGEVHRGAIVHHETTSESEDRVRTNGETVSRADAGPRHNLHADMDVVDADGSKLGKVSEVSTDPTTHRVAHILVEHGMLRKKHKRIPTDTISRVDGDNVVLGLSKRDWGFLSDIEDRDNA
jgi:CBS domain-containing protein/sporulation protein YlmC with PRC-barrel domain